MVNKIMTWICGKLFSALPDKKPKRGFCYWCHRDTCPHPSFEACRDHRLQCEYHPEVKDGSAPSYCHSCCYGWCDKDNWVKPTLFKPHGNGADTRWCLDWICEACDKRNKERKDFEERKYNNTEEAARLVFVEKDGVFLYEGYEPVEADFVVSYESLAPYVTKIIDGASEWRYAGIEFDAAVIREGRVYTRDRDLEYEVTWENKRCLK